MIIPRGAKVIQLYTNLSVIYRFKFTKFANKQIPKYIKKLQEFWYLEQETIVRSSIVLFAVQ